MTHPVVQGAKNGSAEDAAAIHAAHLVVAYAEVTGLVETSNEAGISVEQFNDALRSLNHVGVARQVRTLPIPARMEDFAIAARSTLLAIEDSPLPVAEWPALNGTLEDSLPALVGVSTSSVNRYRSGERDTPDPVAARLHFLTLIVRDLAGSYNDFGIRRWFQRPRSSLGGKTPADLLSGDWDPDAGEIRIVRELAASLVGSGAG